MCAQTIEYVALSSVIMLRVGLDLKIT